MSDDRKPIYVTADEKLLRRVDELLAANLLRGQGPRTRAAYAREALEEAVQRDEAKVQPN